MNRISQVKGRIAAVVFAMLLGGCATDGTGGGGNYGGYYDNAWYGYGYGVACCVDNPGGDIGSIPRPEHPIALPPGDVGARPEQPIATPPRAEPKASVSASTRPSASTRGGSFSGGGFGGGGFGGGGGGGRGR